RRWRSDHCRARTDAVRQRSGPAGALGRGHREQSRPQAGADLSGRRLLQRSQSRSARSTRYRRLCRARTRQAPDSRERKNWRTADPTDAKEDRRWRLRNALPIEKASGGTGVRTNQTGARLPPVPVAGRRKSACRVGHDLHRPQPPEAVHPRKRRLSPLLCKKRPATMPIWTGSSATNFIRVLMPPGIQAPVVVQYNASSVPVLQIGLSSDTLNEQQLYDYGIYRLRQQLAPIHGVTLPTPAGGKYRQIMVDIDPLKLQAKGLTPLDVVNAVNAQNLTLPSGFAKIGDTQFTVRTNAVPTSIEDLNNIPIKYAGGATVFVKDIGQVHDGNAVQQNVVRTDGRRAVLLSIIKNGNASTLAVVNAVKDALVTSRAAAPPGMAIKELFDQSIFVKESIVSLLREGAIAGVLTAMMIILFLGSWRSTLVVMISIPLSILTSLVVLYFLGETINTMTLGGLALAIGILVDDSTVTIENTHRLLTEEHMPL